MNIAKIEEGMRPSLQLKNEQSTAKGEVKEIIEGLSRSSQAVKRKESDEKKNGVKPEVKEKGN